MQNTMNSGMGSLSDKEAKASGFKSAAEMQAFYANRARMRKGNKAGPGMGQMSDREKAPPKKKPAGRSLLDVLNGN